LSERGSAVIDTAPGAAGSPVRRFGGPPAIQGVERTLEFIALTIRGVRNIAYRAVEPIVDPGRERLRSPSSS
jgi:hypothetical protein